MKKLRNKSIKLIKYLLLFFVLYLLFFNIVPYLQPKKVSSSFLANQRNTAYSAAGQDKVTLVEEHQDAFNARLALIAGSQKSVAIVYHTIQDGASTEALLGELVSAAERGVKVRILLDGKVGFINPEVKKQLKALAALANIEVRSYNPIDWQRPWAAQALLHDKFFIVDEKYLLLGGRNIGDKYFKPAGYQEKFADDRDVLICNSRIEGGKSVLTQAAVYMEQLWNEDGVKCVKPKASEELVAELVQAPSIFQAANPDFCQFDLAAYENRMIAADGVCLLTNPTNPEKKEPWLGYQLKELAAAAEKEILIQTPYCTANQLLLENLSGLTKTKRVKIITNSPASTPNYPAFSNYYSQREKFLLTAVELYEYQSKDSIHGKSLVFDQEISAVGSFNLDDRSFYLSTEAMVVIKSPAFAASLMAAIKNFENQSLKVGSNNQYEAAADGQVKEISVPLSKKILLFLSSLFSRPLQFLI